MSEILKEMKEKYKKVMKELEYKQSLAIEDNYNRCLDKIEKEINKGEDKVIFYCSTNDIIVFRAIVKKINSRWIYFIF